MVDDDANSNLDLQKTMENPDTDPSGVGDQFEIDEIV
jgi:hypothetical protein